MPLYGGRSNPKPHPLPSRYREAIPTPNHLRGAYNRSTLYFV